MNKKTIICSICVLFFCSGICFAEPPQIGGFIHTRFSAGSSENDSFAMQRARVKLTGSTDEKTDYTIMLDAEQTPILIDAVLNRKLGKNFNLSVGQFKIPFSAEALVPATKKDLINNYLYIGQMLPPICRDIGIMAKGSLHKEKIEYFFGIFNGNGPNSKNTDDKYLYVARIKANPISFLWAGISYDRASKTAGGVSAIETGMTKYTKNLIQADLEFQKGSAFLKGEYVLGKYNRASAANIKANSLGITSGYFITKQKLSAIVRYEKYDPNTSAKNNKDKIWTTIGLNYVPEKKILLQINYIFKNEAMGNLKDDLFITQLQYCF
ncbi:MAG: OprO/OprP family phosphate-selective porin [Elusimicrobia bacterium]|nr:OprO/OprP family phosphate-selective porin [Elusimicrobiota bacterium]